MESLCTLRDIYRLIRLFELKFQQAHDLCLNEGMLLCSLKDQKYSSSEIAEVLGLTNSNASKVIRSVENKGFIDRILGDNDKRQMYFILSEKGLAKLAEIKCEKKEIDIILGNILSIKK